MLQSAEAMREPIKATGRGRTGGLRITLVLPVLCEPTTTTLVPRMPGPSLRTAHRTCQSMQHLQVCRDEITPAHLSDVCCELQH
jgi:hypothetical protein